MDNPPEETIALRSESLDAGMGTDKPARGTAAVREALRSLGVDRVIELGNILEVVTILLDMAEVELVIHAMSMRPKYEPLLRRLGDPDV